MKVVVSGAAGFLGRATVRSLRARDHSVVGIVRRPSSANVVRAAGGTPVVADITDPHSLAAALSGAEAVVHLAQPADGTMIERRAVRVEGGRNLAVAAVNLGCARFVVGSGYWVYEGGAAPIDEGSPLAPRSISLVNHETEQAVAAVARPAGLAVIVARPGMVYGPGSWFAEMVRELSDGSYRYIADGSNRLSPVHLEDAGEAFSLLIERGDPSLPYLVVDDHPVGTRTFAEDVAHRIGAPPPQSLSMEEARQAWGEDLAELNRADRAASNRRLRSLGWVPRYRQYGDGLPAVLAALHPEMP